MSNVQVLSGNQSMRPGLKNAMASSSRLSTLKDLVSQRDYRSFFDVRRQLKPTDPGYVEGLSAKQSWREWAGDRFKRKNSSSTVTSVEKLTLFPGWATRRYHGKQPEGTDVPAFSLEVFVSGFAASCPLPDYTTRSQRAFMRLAKSFAALPKIPGTNTSPGNLSQDDLSKRIHLPPTPTEITEESEMQELEYSLRRLEAESENGSSSESEVSGPPSPARCSPPSYFNATPNGDGSRNSLLDDALRQHMTLSERLQPFWSSSLGNRIVRLSLYSSSPNGNLDSDDQSKKPILTQTVLTSPQGAFQSKISVPWEDICQHPGALYIAFGEKQEDHELFIHAELVPLPSASKPSSLTTESPPPSPEAPAQATLSLHLSHSKVRLISDIDDTIKLSNILGGARTVFRNVFVKRLEELVIKGMGDWYTDMWTRGVRFHYVSNGPFQLLPIVSEFIKVSNLPQGSIKMRSYAGRSLFNGLLSAPANRKRDGVLEVLDAFSCSRFILVGDSGEQDLELYAQIAAERHHQILAVFIRDASGQNVKPLDDPTGEAIKQAKQKQKKPSGPKRSISFGLYPSSSALSLTAVSKNGTITPLPTKPPAVAQLESSPNVVSSQRTPMQSDYVPTPVPNSLNKDGMKNIQLPPPSMTSSGRRPTRTPNMLYLDTGSGRPDYLNAKPLNDPKAVGNEVHPRNPLRSPSDPLPGGSNGQMPSTFFDAGLPISLSDSPPTSSPSYSPLSSNTSSSSSSSSSHITPGSFVSQPQPQFDPRLGSIQVPGVLRPAEVQALSPPEKKRYDLQLRVYKARLMIPSHIPLRIFTDPEECVEASTILDNIGTQARSRSCSPQ